MKAIWQKARADLWGRRWQSLLILTTIGAAASLLYLGLLTLTAATDPLEQLIERTRGAHVYFLISGSDGVSNMADRLAADPAVTATALRPTYGTELLLPGRDENAEVLVQPVEPGASAMMDHLIMAGRGLESGRSGEAVLSISLARYFTIDVGDQIRLALPDGPQALTVVGLSADPLWCAYPTCSPQNLYILPETFAQMTAGVPTRNYLLGARLLDPDAADSFLSQAVKEAGPVRIVTPLSWLTIQKGTQLINGLSASSLLVFALTAITAAALITVNLVGGAVLAQFREIAILKVLGFTARQVQLLFAIQNLLLGLTGACLGVTAGQLAAGRMLIPLAENMGNPGVLQFQPELAAWVVALIAGVALLVGLVAAWPAVALRPAAALRDGFGAPLARTPWPVQLLSRLRAPGAIILGVKDVTARPGRALLTVASLTLCIVTISISAGTGRFARQLETNLDLLGMPYDLLVGVKAPYTVTDAEAIARDLPGVEAFARRTQMGVVATEQDAAFRLDVFEGDWRAIPWQVTAGRLPEGPDEIMLATSLLRRLGAQVGDRLDLELKGQTVTWTISGAYRNPMELGQVGLTSLDTLRQVLPNETATGLVIRVSQGSDPAAVRAALLEQSDYRLTISLMRTFITGGFMRDILQQISVLAVMMAAIAALSMLNTALLTAREQVREVGIRKAMGMTPAQILASVGAGGAWFGLIAAALGVPLGLWLHGSMTQLMSRQLSDGHVPLDHSPVLIGALLLGGIALAVASALPAAAWAGRIVTAQALRAE